MKVLIWFLCIFANALITTLIKEAGVILGAIPTVILYGATFWLARTLCKKWDEHKENKAVEQNVSVQAVQTAPADTTEQVRFCRKCGEKFIANIQFCHKCGTKVDDDIVIESCVACSIDEPICEIQKEAVAIKKTQEVTRFPFYHMIAIILSAISIVSMIIAMNMQDVGRNIYEAISPTILYSILIVLYLISSVLSIFFKNIAVKSILGFIPVVATVTTLFEGSLFSERTHYGLYINNHIVSTCNIIWVVSSFLIFLIVIVPLCLKLPSKWHRTLQYREYCYKRVERMKIYLDKGIITEEEYKKNKADILKNVKI